MSTDAHAFAFTASTVGTLPVLSFRGCEAVSEPYRFDLRVAVAAHDAPDFEGAVLGQRARFTIQTQPAPRHVAGVVSSVRSLGELDAGRHVFGIRLVPRLRLLGHRVASRIFQGQSVPVIVGAVLDE